MSGLSWQNSPRHYRPMWAEPLPPAPARLVVSVDKIRAAFPHFPVTRAQQLRRLLEAGSDPVDAGDFGSDYASQRRALAALARLGVECEAVRKQGYRLTEATREAVRAALEKVPG